MVRIEKLIQKMKSHPRSADMGMVATHLGLVRGTSLDGRAVTGLEVSFDQERLAKIIQDIKRMDGVIDVAVEVSGGCLAVGDEIMAVAVGGDTRENVFPALVAAVDRIKREATAKKEMDDR